MNILERFQTLVAGCLAVIAAIIAYRGAVLQGQSAISGAQIQAEASANAVKTQLETAYRRDREQEDARRFAFSVVVVSSLSTVADDGERQRRGIKPDETYCSLTQFPVPSVLADDNWPSISLMPVKEQRVSRELIHEIKSYNQTFVGQPPCSSERAKSAGEAVIRIEQLTKDLTNGLGHWMATVESGTTQ